MATRLYLPISRATASRKWSPGFRKGHTVVLYRNDGKGEWSRQILDNQITSAGCAAADLNGDGRIDLVCIGSATANLIWYENVTAKK